MILLSSGRASTRHPPDAVFARWADPATWPEWDPDLEWVRFAGPAMLGSRGTLKPTSGPPLSFAVSAFEEDRVFTDTGTLPGARLAFEHRVTPVPGGSEAVVEIRVHGALAWLWKRVMGGSLRGAAQSSLDGLLAHLDGRG
ncbi:SRPBCC family protein [Agromyces ramosus]|uniref:Polyketide cyclase/dehydrase/lipid transport protein n=1 Tax=Agromyces ramosus TaxID=33879 RepID=A0ABU0RBA4_9MICO|nr:SRPBCC family protein [Agromyces ramosus]MDQ0895042.1 hypothetical protein [Agromyces ramosus]